MFRGISAITIDAKGRMSMPMRYRGYLADKENNRIVVTIDTEEHCLLLYPFSAWEIIEQKIVALSSFNEATRKVQRILIGHATEIELDANGRILLPATLREYATLEKKAVLVGQGKKFEIWNEVNWSQRRAEWLASTLIDSEKLPDALKDLSL